MKKEKPTYKIKDSQKKYKTDFCFKKSNTKKVKLVFDFCTKGSCPEPVCEKCFCLNDKRQFRGVILENLIF